MSNLNNSVYFCKEVFDENSEPTKLEIEEQASRLGIDPVKELHLLGVAKQCLLEPLPSNWLPCYIEKENKYFYYNNQSKTSQWEHPLDEYYRQIIEKIRSEDSSTGQDISLNIILDEDNLLDTMYHTNTNYEKKNVTEKRTVRFKTPIEESLDLDDSDDNMKFLGPIKLNSPYTSTLSNLQNLPQFSTTNTYDPKSTGSRSVLSKYNILPSKDESSRKSDVGENIKAVNTYSSINVNNYTGKDNLRKIDITLTESSDRSESTSSDIHTENLNSDYEREGNDLNKKDNVVTTIQVNKEHERNNDDGRSARNNFIDTIGTTQLYNMKKDDLVSDSGNSTGKDSKILQSNATISFSATKSKMAEITQRFPLNQFTNEPKLLKMKPIESDEGVNAIKSNSIKFELTNDFNDKTQTFMDTAQIKILIENHCDFIKNKMEDTFKTKEKIFREELIKKIDDVTREQNYNFEKRFEARHNELYTKNELELKNLIKNMQEKTEHSLYEKFDKKYVQNVSNPEQMRAENVIKFQKDLDDYSEVFKNQIQSEIDAMYEKLKKELYENSEIITESLKEGLGSYKHVEMEKIKNYFEHTFENVKRDTDNDVHQFNLELKENLKIMSKDKLNNVAEQLDLLLQEEINLVKKQVHKNCLHDINVEPSKNEPLSKQDLNSENKTIDMHKVSYNALIKTIQHCSNELNNALKMINKISTNDCISEHSMDLYLKKCTVSCQTDNIISSYRKPSSREYTYPESSNTPLFNNSYGTYTNYADYWNKANVFGDLHSNYITTNSSVFNPLDVLCREELKVNAAEQNICNLIDTFNNLKQPDVYHTPNNTNIYQNKFTSIYQPQTPKQIAHNRTRHLREWLHKTSDSNNKLLY